MALQSHNRTRLRLTRRGRMVVTALVALPIVIALLWFSMGSGSGAVASDEQASVSFETVQVGYGDSLWQIAERVAPGEDPREVINEIIALNQLHESMLRPGQVLSIPLRLSPVPE